MFSAFFLIILLGIFFGLAYRKIDQIKLQNPKYQRVKNGHYSWLVVLWCGGPALILFAFLNIFQNHIITHLVLSNVQQLNPQYDQSNIPLLISQIKQALEASDFFSTNDPIVLNAITHYHELTQQLSWLSLIICASLLVVLGLLKLKNIKLDQKKPLDELSRIWVGLLFCCALIAIFTTATVIAILISEALAFFSQYPLFDFLFGFKWSPQIAIRDDQIASAGAFGAIPVFWGTFVIATIALLVATPIGLMSAIYLSQFAHKRLRDWLKPSLEILAGVPTVVYGFIAAIQIAPLVHNLAQWLNIPSSSQSALAAGLVMGVMLIPFISSLSEDVLSAVPNALRDGSLALGATKTETVLYILFPAALPGIMGSFLLAVSRAIGETMIVVMAAGLAAKLTANPFDSLTTVTVQIVTLLVGDHEFDDIKTLSAFALAITLFFLTLGLNIIALKIVRNYREIYE
ncbi:MAG: phosphate ABC transporter permease subunit PstC [Pseudomonadota bacterium]